MKTLQYFQQERERILDAATSAEPKEYKKLQEEIKKNDVFLMYMETSPTKEFLATEYNRLNNRLITIMNDAPRQEDFVDEYENFQRTLYKQHLAEYNKTMGTADLRRKISAIKHLLTND